LRLAALDLWKNYYNLEPALTTSIGIFVWFPWDIKVLYGLIGDSVPVCGSRKRPWLIIMGFIQFTALVLAAICLPKCTPTETVIGVKNTTPFTCVPTVSYQTMAFFLFCANLGTSFCDVIVDGLMIVQSKRDPVNGSSDIQSLSFGVQATASMIGCILSAFAT